MAEEKKRVAESVAETVHIVRPNHLNGAGRLFGGILMQWIDEVAAIVAKRHCRKNVTTVSVDNLHFIRGAYPNDDVVIIGKLTYVGTTSMEIKVDTYVEDKKWGRTHINQAYLTIVALDENDRPVRVPGLILETEEEKEAWESAKIRCQARHSRKTEQEKRQAATAENAGAEKKESKKDVVI